MLVLWVAAILAVGCSMEISDEEYSRLPRLYHLDDYSSCLARRGGLYCLGSFAIQPPRNHDPVYDLIKEYSSDPHHFNRTQLHRGYCVSERCPSPEQNSSRRFEECAARWGRRKGLRLSLSSLTYCKTHAQEFARAQNPDPYDLGQKVFLAVLAVLCAANLAGTVYDVCSGDDKKNELLSVWSLRSNWRRLTATYEDGDPRLNALSPVQGIRVFLMLLIIGTHGGCIHDMLYLHNPQFVEKVSRNPFFMIFMNGTGVVMVFVVVSSFLLCYNLLLLGERIDLKPAMLPYVVLKRVARISPVYLLVTGFAATFWSSARGGPLWAAVEAEARVCRDKFWAHALYLNNLLQPDDHCLVQTWFLATDMQLYVVAALLTLALPRRRALAALAALAVASCLLNGLLAYVFDWKSLIYYVYPGTLHTMYHGVASFYRLYTAPWGSLPACLLGLLLAHLHHGLQARGINVTHYTWFRWAYTMSPVLIVSWICAGNWVRELTAPGVTAAYAALERPALSLLAATLLLGLFNGMTGFLQNWFSWSGWSAMGRMSLSVLMVHWIINSCIAASRPQPISTSLLDVTVDSVATAVMSYIVAVPLTLMVEMPCNRLVDVIFFKRHQSPPKEVKT